MRVITPGLLLAVLPLAVNAQMVVNTSLTPAQLVNDVLVGQGVNVSNITYNGVAIPATAQAGTGSFTAAPGSFALTEGLILTSAFASSIPGSEPGINSDQTGNGSDPDLLAIITELNPTFPESNDRAVLEFDFVPTGDSLKFNYVFASEEYPGFNCNSQFNDVFGFFLSGPGISGPFTNNAANIAIVPGTNLPVSIANIHGPEGFGCPPANAEYYIHNAGGSTVIFGGYTTVLTAKAAVQCGQTYHIKLAICDAGDSNYDSAVFLDANSFVSLPIVPTLAPGPGIVGDTIYEACFPVTLNFIRRSDPSVYDTLNMVISGTATAGVDYAPPLPTQVVFEPGVEVVPFQFQAFIDGDADESITVGVVIQSECSNTTIHANFEFWIKAVPSIIAIGGAQMVDCGQSVTLAPNIVGGFGLFEYTWPDGSAGATYTFTPTGDTDVLVAIVDSCGQSSEAYFAVGITPPPALPLTLTGPTPLREGCDSGLLTIQRPAGSTGDIAISFNGTGAANFPADYHVNGPVVIPTGQNSVSVPLLTVPDGVAEGSENFILNATYAANSCNQTGGGWVSGTIVDTESLRVTGTDLVEECTNDSIPLMVVVEGGTGNLSYVWSNGVVGPIGSAQGEYDAYYHVTVTDECGNTGVGSVFVNVLCDFIIPNVFTPNGDGKNDRWVIRGIQASKNTVRVFDRWGGEVFSAHNYANNWNATGLSDGTYFYEVIVEGESKPYTGHLTILAGR